MSTAQTASSSPFHALPASAPVTTSSQARCTAEGENFFSSYGFMRYVGSYVFSTVSSMAARRRLGNQTRAIDL
jgi:hypothetical protein